MPAFGIKPQFNEKLLTGSKLFTLRHPRKDKRAPAITGQTLYFYNGLRTSKATKVAEKPCLFVADVKMIYSWIAVCDWPAIIFPEQLDTFARLDGFKNYTEFCEFHGIQDGSKMRILKMIAWAEEKQLRATILGKFDYERKP